MNSRRYSRFLASLVTSLFIFSLLISPAQAAAGDTIRVSVASDGTQGNGFSSNPSISADGRYVAFTSDTSNLVVGDTNGFWDVFVHDRWTGLTTRVSIATNGTQGNGGSLDASISADGRYVAFTSSANNLVTGDTNGQEDVFVYDQESGQTTLVSVKSDGSQQNQSSSSRPFISSSGRYIVFESLFLTSNCGWAQIFIHDMQTAETMCVSVNSSGVQGNGISNASSVSADGRYVTFMSSSSLVADDNNGMEDIYVHDRVTGQTTRVSVASDGTQGNGHSWYPSISADGLYMVFASDASNLVPGDSNSKQDVFVHDRLTGQTIRVSVASDGTQGNGESMYSRQSYISADGRYITFASTATNLANNCANGEFQVFIHDRNTGQIFCASVSSGSIQGNSSSSYPTISADGRYVAFVSYASNLVSDDTNGTHDVFVHENDVPIAPFLDLPFQYTNFQEAAKGSNGGGGLGYVNSWFDHTNPGYGNADGNLTTWLGPYQGTKDITRASCTTLGESCYDSHDGIDFRHVSDEVLAAAPGTVFGIGYQPSGFGNFLYIDHENCYASFYAHLKNAPTLQNGDTVIDRQQVGIMGNTGLSIGGGGGVHLHFGLYYDPTCDGDFSDKIVVDPYGWSGIGLDPWTNGTSRYLWKHAYDFAQQSITSSGGSASTPSGNLAVTVPAGAVVNPITLELWNTPPVAGASATLRSTGNSFWMRVLEWLTGGSSPSLMASASTNSFDVPVTVTVNYDPSLMPHLDTSQLTIKQWDDVGLAWITLSTTLDTVNQQASAQTSQPGHFDMQAPLVCPADTLEPNDNYDGASVVQTDGTSVSNLFDISTDEDWFKFDAVVGTQYDIQTSNLATGVDTALELYDTDGVTLLVSNDNGGAGSASYLNWQAPQDGLYFARVTQASGSSFGCSSTYNFAVTVVDTTAPTVNTFTVTSPSNSLNILITAFTATDNIGVIGYLITTSTTAPATGAVGWTGAAPTIYAVVSDGSYTLYPWAKDAVGNVSLVFGSPSTVVVDTTAPDTTIITKPAALDNDSTPTFTFSGNDGTGSGVASFMCRMDSGTYTTCTSPFTSSALSDGSHTFDVYAIDIVGNADVSPASHTWTLDTTAPDTTIITKPANLDNDSTPTFTFSGNDGAGSGIASFMCRMDSGTYAPCSSPFTSPALTDGSHTFDVYAIDMLGNADASPASYTWILETNAPIVTSIARVNPSPTNLASVTFTVTFSESVTGVDMVGPLFDDFALTITGVTGTSITNASGSGSAYAITVNTGAGNGTIRLDIPVSATITDLAGNPLASLPYITGDEYIVTKVFNLFLPLILR